LVEIEQIYLRSRSREEEIHIRKRGYDGSYLYFLRRTLRNARATMSEELIDEQQFYNLRKLIDPKTEPLLKERFCFLWENHHFELDKYGGRHEGLWILGAEPRESSDPMSEVPPFVPAKKKITDVPQYAEKRMALRKS
jgi:CYTH domain-containing protein